MKSHRRLGKSAEQKVILVFTLCTVIGVAVVGVVMWYSFERWQLTHALIHLESRAKTLASIADSEILAAQRELELLSRMPSFQQFPDVDRVEPLLRGVPEDVEVEKRLLLEDLMRTFERSSVLYVLLPNGDIYLVYPFAVHAKLTQSSLADRPYYQEAVRTKKTVVSDSFIGADGIPTVAILVPILNDASDAVAYLGGAIHLTKLSQLLDRKDIAPFDAGFIVDRQGNLVAHSNSALVGGDTPERFAMRPFVSEMTKNIPGEGTDDLQGIRIGEYVDPEDGKRYMTAWVPMRNGWYLGLMRDRAEILATSRSVVWRSILLATMLFLLISGIAILSAKRIGRRWHAAERALLANEEALQANQERLRSAIADLENSNRDLDERTKELSCLYGVSKIVADVNKPMTDSLQEMVNLFPRAWQYPEKICARIILDGNHFETERFNETRGKLSSDIVVAGKKAGVAEVFYLEEMPDMDEGSFLTEEQQLLEELSRIIGMFITHRRVEKERDHILNLSYDLICVEGMDGYFKYVNPAWEKTLGYTTKELLSKPFIDFIHPDDHDINDSEVEKLKKSEHAIGFENHYIHKDGSIRTISWIATALEKEEKMYCIGRDITERKKAEEEVTRLAKFPSENPNPVLRVDGDGRIIYANQGSRAVLEYWKSAENEILPVKWRERIRSVINLNQVASFEEELADSIFLLTVTPVSDMGYVNIYGLDITALKESEEALIESKKRYQKAQALGHVGNWEYDLETSLFWTSEEGKRIYGFDEDTLNFDAEEVENCIPERERVHQALIDLIEEGKEYNLEFDIITHDHSQRKTILSIAELERDADGTPIKVIGVIADITELKKYRDHLEELVQARTAELEAFSHSVSHDLRAPLRSMDGFSQAVLKDYAEKLDERGRDYLRRVRAASQKMGHLIDDLLKLARVSRAEMGRGRVDLSVLARSIAGDCKAAEPDRKVEFRIEDGLTTEGDSRLLRLMLENLVGNAWKFTSKGKKALIEFGRIDRAGKQVYFVRDNGAGFEMKYVDKLFGPFQRLHTEKEFPGTGIGLATVRRIVSRHGGEVWAEGAEGEGVTIYFTLS